MKNVKLFWIALLGLLVNVSVAQDLDEVLASHFEAVNQEVLTEVETIHMKGKSGRMGQEFNFEIWQMRPNKFRMEAEVQGQKMVQVFDGEKAYFVAPWTGSLEPQELGETQTDQLKEQADMDGELWNWKEKGSTLTLEGMEDFEGAEVYILKLIKKNKDVKTIYLDADSFLPIKTSAKIQMQGSEVEAEAYMSNYKEVHNMVMPFYIENRMGGEVANSVTIVSIEIDEKLDKALFEKPKSPEKKPEAPQEKPD